MLKMNQYLSREQWIWVLEQYPMVKQDLWSSFWIKLSELVEEKYKKKIRPEALKNQVNSMQVS